VSSTDKRFSVTVDIPEVGLRINTVRIGILTSIRDLDRTIVDAIRTHLLPF
jgi:hypothetical protein